MAHQLGKVWGRGVREVRKKLIDCQVGSVDLHRLHNKNNNLSLIKIATQPQALRTYTHTYTFPPNLHIGYIIAVKFLLCIRTKKYKTQTTVKRTGTLYRN